MRIVKGVSIFFGSFLLLHLLFSSFFPVDENNVLQAPDWYAPLGFGISAVVTFLFTRKQDSSKSRSKNTTDTSNNSISYSEHKDPAAKKAQCELATEIPANVEICVDPVSKVVVAPTALDDSTSATDINYTEANTDDHRCSKVTLIAESYDEDDEYLTSNIVDRWQQQHLNAQETPSADIRDTFAIYGGIEAELLTIDLMEGHDFEYWCANALRDMGYTNVQVTPGSGDQGVDILADMNGIRYAIQCKRYSSDLGNTPIQEVHAGKYMYHCHIGAVITNQRFTSGAKELAEATGILLWDRDWILQYLTSKANKDGSLHIEHTPIVQACASPLHDEMLPAAVDVILETGQASVSMLQRHLKFGYARCARIVDEMEELGMVGPFEGSKPRAILITKKQWETMKASNAK